MEVEARIVDVVHRDVKPAHNLVAQLARAEPTFDALACMFTSAVGVEPPVYAPPSDGESLHAADTVDVTVLGSR